MTGSQPHISFLCLDANFWRLVGGKVEEPTINYVTPYSRLGCFKLSIIFLLLFSF